MFKQLTHGADLTIDGARLLIPTAGDAVLFVGEEGEVLEGEVVELIEARERWLELGGDEAEFTAAIAYVDSIR